MYITSQDFKLLSPTEQIDWVQQNPPADRPSCGFDGEECEDYSSLDGTVALVLGILLFCSFVVILTFYRKWKIEMEIEGLLWKIEPSDLIGFYGNDVVSSTKVSPV